MHFISSDTQLKAVNEPFGSKHAVAPTDQHLFGSFFKIMFVLLHINDEVVNSNFIDVMSFPPNDRSFSEHHANVISRTAAVADVMVKIFKLTINLMSMLDVVLYRYHRNTS